APGDALSRTQAQSRSAPGGAYQAANPSAGKAVGNAPVPAPTAGAPALGVPNTAGAPVPGLPDRIIKTGAIGLEVKEGTFDQAWSKVVQAAVRFGGYVAGSDRGSTTIDDDERPYGSITLRIPARRFEEALVALRSLGKVTGDESSSNDVTQEFTDIESRLRNLRSQQAVLLRLMDKARTVGETLNVQSHLSHVQSEIEQLTGRRNVLAAQTDLSTITVSLAEPGAVEPKPASWIEKAWNQALDGLEGIGTVLFVGAIWLAPLAVLFALAMAILRRFRRPAPAPGA
ncbi:MAG: DUF4349 domain-containing protein, partial [Actinomycetota bacterium]